MAATKRLPDPAMEDDVDEQPGLSRVDQYRIRAQAETSLLIWVRTSLGLMGFGFVLAQRRRLVEAKGQARRRIPSVVHRTRHGSVDAGWATARHRHSNRADVRQTPAGHGGEGPEVGSVPGVVERVARVALVTADLQAVQVLLGAQAEAPVLCIPVKLKVK